MKNEIVTCISNTHELNKDNFKRNNIKVGKSYKCIDELVLTTANYYRPEFKSMPGITIKSHVDRWGWCRPCLPKECFRIATESEVRKYKILMVANMPFRYLKIRFYKLYRNIDRVIRWKYYKELNEMY